MVKRKRADCSKQDGKDDSSIDRISMLPDELLVFILSHLTFKEATATSILSLRWRYLWTFTRRLDFDDTKSLMKLQYTYELQGYVALLDEERSNYVKWVNHVIALRKDSPVEDFKVYFYLSKAYEGCIDEWVKYALARKVQTLELNLSKEGCPITHEEFCSFSYRSTHEEFCSFPYRILHMDQEICSIHFKQLKKILLNSVNVNGEALEFFLCNCPLLEDLSVSQSIELLTLRIIGPFPSLKCLEISRCDNLSLVEIRDVNLVYLKYAAAGRRTDFLLHNTPVLVDIFIRELSQFGMEYLLGQFSSILPQLEKLNIEIATPAYSWGTGVKMSNLKQLVVTHFLSCADSLLPLIILIRAAPRLEKFVLKSRLSERRCGERKMQKMKKKNWYHHLKQVEFLGYCGATCELELVMHFLESGVALEKMIIDPRKFYWHPYRGLCHNSDSITIKRENKARDRANKQLADQLAQPQGIILEIL